MLNVSGESGLISQNIGMATLTCLNGPNLELYTLCYYLFYFIYLFYLLFYLFILFSYYLF